MVLQNYKIINVANEGTDFEVFVESWLIMWGCGGFNYVQSRDEPDKILKLYCQMYWSNKEFLVLESSWRCNNTINVLKWLYFMKDTIRIQHIAYTFCTLLGGLSIFKILT